MKPYKAFIRVVKSIRGNEWSSEYYGAIKKNVIEEPLIYAKSKEDVKRVLKQMYPQFFPNNKVYSRETKDKAQFFYVLIYELDYWEIKQLKSGRWSCSHCQREFENMYIKKCYQPICQQDYNKLFCDRQCYERYKIASVRTDVELLDNPNYIKESNPNYIYKITEKVTGKCYIGKTKNAPFFRWWEHLTHSSSPFGLYLSSTPLANWNFEIIEELPANVSDEIVFQTETKYIKKYNSIENGFNKVVSYKKQELK